MPKSRPPYPAEFRQQMIELVRAGRTPAQLSREFGAQESLRPGERAWVVGVTPENGRIGSHYDQFPPGNVYTIEYEDGESVDIHESDLASAADS